MQIAAVAVSATDLARAVAFYELLGFVFPPLGSETQHIEAEGAVRLMIDDAVFLTELHGERPAPGQHGGLRTAVRLDSAEVDTVAARVAGAGHAVVTPPYDAPWGQRYATVADPDGYRVDLFALLPG